ASLDLMAAYPPDIVELAQYDAEDFDFTCRTWDVGAAGSIEDQPVVSDIPTLILAGEYDPVTPPVWGEVAERSLTNDLLLIFPGVGHAAIDSGPCPESIVLDFLAAGSVAGLDTSCMAGMGPPAFVTD
ncbi:MAG: hypothetical protein GYB64_08015, partial [Chloroflexi bacterium]|nr:hypothetical protein [Chloroflexota bacterium]